MENGTTVLEHFSNCYKDDDVNNSIRMMPKHTKFLIISMTGSFTDIHFDFSRCFITYSKDRNMGNLNKFMRLQKNRKPESKRKPKWIPSMMPDKWQRRNFLMEKDYPENPTEYDDDHITRIKSEEETSRSSSFCQTVHFCCREPDENEE
ncbi:unnamed protein product [Caenorhabditis brenneri]